MSGTTCETCFDTGTVDMSIDGVWTPDAACPDCAPNGVAVKVKITGLSHGIGEYGSEYATAKRWSSSTITFVAPTIGDIMRDVEAVRRRQILAAGGSGRGRSSISSWAIAIAKRVEREWAKR